MHYFNEEVNMSQEELQFFETRMAAMFWVLSNKHVIKAMGKFREQFEGTGLSFGGALMDGLTYLDVREGTSPGELIAGYGEVIDFTGTVSLVLDDEDEECDEDCSGCNG